MDDGEIEVSNPEFLLNPITSPNNDYYNYNPDEIVKHTKTCTHTHTCNPPGPVAAHTHTCYHTHSQVFSAQEDTKTHFNFSSVKPTLGNREAVRKYREKKKAHTAFLEAEVKKLRVLNQHLVKKVQGQAVLEAEISSLRALLIEIRGKVDVELGCLPFQKHCNTNSSPSFEKGKAIGLQFPVQNPCFASNLSTDGVYKPVFSWQENCQPAIVDCHAIGNEMVAALDQPFEAGKK